MNTMKRNENEARKKKDRRLDIDFWTEVLQGEIPPLFIETRSGTLPSKTRLCIELFFQLIRNGAQLWEHKNGTSATLSAHDLENKLIHLLPIIYEQINLIENRTAYFTSLRINSWLKRDYRLRRTLSAKKEDYIREQDKGGRTGEIALKRDGSSNQNNLIDLTDNPQRDVTEKEEDSIIVRVLDKLESSGRHGPVYRNIMNMLLDGINVGEDDAETLNVEKNQAALLVYQARMKTRKIAAEEDRELAEKIDLLQNQIEKKRKKDKLIELIIFLFIISDDKNVKRFLAHLIFNSSSAHKAKKSTKKEKEQKNQPDNEDDARKHGPIKIVTKDGSTTTISYEESLKLKKNIPRRRGRKKALVNTEAQRNILLPWFG
jgi:hypothetical protein